jgi:hypothetical protein
MSFPERHSTMSDELQITSILCRTLLSDLCFIQPAFHELVLVPSSGRLSPLYCHMFTVFLILHILHVSGIRPRWHQISFLRTSQTSSNSSHWMDSSITPTIVFLKSHLPPYRKHAVLYGWCSPGAHLSKNTPSNYGNQHQCSNLSPDLACTILRTKSSAMTTIWNWFEFYVKVTVWHYTDIFTVFFLS